MFITYYNYKRISIHLCSFFTFNVIKILLNKLINFFNKFIFFENYNTFTNLIFAII